MNTQGALTGATQGASIGSAFGPWGTAIGAVGGALMSGKGGEGAPSPVAQPQMLGGGAGMQNSLTGNNQIQNPMATMGRTQGAGLDFSAFK